MDNNLIRAIVRLIPRARRRGAVKMVILMVIGALMDLFSLASFFPILLLLLGRSDGKHEVLINLIHTWLGTSDTLRAGMILTTIAVLVIFAKTAYHFWITRAKAVVAYDIAGDVAKKGMANYLNGTYQRFITTDYTQEMNRLSNIPLNFANNILIPCSTFLVEGILLLLLILVLLAFNTKAFGLTMLILLPATLVFLYRKRSIDSINKNVKLHYPRLLKYTLRNIENWIEISIYQKVDYFLNEFTSQFRHFGFLLSKDHALIQSTSRITEAIASLFVGGLMLFTFWTAQTPNESILLLAVYAGISFRAIPSINRILTSMQQIKTHLHVLSELEDLLQPSDNADNQSSIITFKETIEFKHLTFSYSTSVPVILNLSMVIRKGEKILIHGTSGGGKTTFLLLFMRFLHEQSGALLVDGNQLAISGIRSWQKQIAYVPQNPQVIDGTIAENIAFGIPEKDRDYVKLKQVAADLALDQWVMGLELNYNTHIGEKGVKISGGQRQRLVIARSLYHQAEIFLLDEITNQVDPDTEQEIIDSILLLASKRKTIIMVAHHPPKQLSFDSVYALQNGSMRRVDPFTNPKSEP